MSENVAISEEANSATESLEEKFRNALAGLYKGGKQGEAVLSAIDYLCQLVASTLGECLKTSRGKDVLNSELVGWIWGQYRGTALSGKRELQDYYVDPDLGTPALTDYLLEFYWATYGIAASIGELFHRRIIAAAPSAVDGRQGLVKWYALRVTLQGENLQFIDENHEEQNGMAYFELRVPDKWIETLLPEKQFEDLKRRLTDLASAADQEGQGTDGPRRQREIRKLLAEQFGARLTRNVNSLVHNLLAAEFPVDTSSTQAKAFLNQPELTSDACLEIMAKAVQMFSIYWRWGKNSDEDPGDLLVVAPLPLSREMRSIPLMGLAFAFKSRNDTATHDHARQITEFLSATLVPQLRRFATDWENQRTKLFIEKFKKRTDFLKGKPLDHLRKSLVDELHLNPLDFEYLFVSVAPVLETVSKMVPHFVHEGHRFGVSIFLGLPYHEQVLGAKIAGLGQLKDKLAGKDRPIDLNLTRPIVESCYSLLDSSDVVLFGTINSDDNNPVTWTSLLKLDGNPLGNEGKAGWSNALRYETLTRGHNNLVAISVEQNGKMRVFSGGKALLQFRGDKWEEGSGTLELKRTLASVLQMRLELPEPLGNTELDDFASLIQRISEMPGAGALFVITQSTEEDVNRYLPEISAPPQELYGGTLSDLLNDPLDTVFRLATMDGATVICIPPHNLTENKGFDLSTAKIYPRRIIAERFHLQDIIEHTTWPDWREALSYGARRTSAVALALQSGTAGRSKYLCVAVSSDGPVYLMPGDDSFVTRAN